MKTNTRYEIHVVVPSSRQRVLLSIRQTASSYEAARDTITRLLRNAYGPGVIYVDNSAMRFVHSASPNAASLGSVGPLSVADTETFTADAAISVFVAAPPSAPPPFAVRRPSVMLYRPSLDIGERALQLMCWYADRWPFVILAIVLLAVLL